MIVVHKTPTCGCCGKWVDHLKAAGFEVETQDHDVLADIKEVNGVLPEVRTCHTALVGGYVVEGHVPAEHVIRLLKEKPDIAGIAVPGMPIGSPGMEGPNPQPYDVIAWDKAGNKSVFAHVKAAGS
jgi:hypothetical protein